jgi:hypothetical protein
MIKISIFATGNRTITDVFIPQSLEFIEIFSDRFGVQRKPFVHHF